MEPPRRVLVLGVRRTGQAVARVLAARGCAVRAADAQDSATLGLDPAALPGAPTPSRGVDFLNESE